MGLPPLLQKRRVFFHQIGPLLMNAFQTMVIIPQIIEKKRDRTSPLRIFLIFILYFCPTPGGSLIGETTAAFVMGALIPTASLGIFVILWRFFDIYLGVILGGGVMLGALSDREEITQALARAREQERQL